MAINSVDRLARELSALNQSVSSLQQNITPDEEDAQLNLEFTNSLKISGELVITKKTLYDEALAFDRPSLGLDDFSNINLLLNFDEFEEESS